jgi:hypothetical protein
MADVVITSGPLFDGRAENAAERYTEKVKQKIADEGQTRIHAHLSSVLRRDTGIYQSHIHTERQVDDIVLTDTPIVYGPWLEGDGSRNFPKTRFPGYRTFRFVFQGLDRDAEALAEAELRDGGYLEEMN